MPILASSRSAWSVNARPVTKSETVKPMPATAPMPTNWRHETSVGSVPIRSRTANHVKAVTPTSLPTTRPTTTPWVIDDDHASANASAVIGTPALARANSGTMTKLDHGCKRCSSHSTTDTDPRARSAVWRACATVDTSGSDAASIGWRRSNGPVGVSRPRATPATVAWMPDS